MTSARGRLRVASHFPGRLRVRADVFCSGTLGAEVAERLGGEPGVSSATVAPRTGSLLVLYDAKQIQLPAIVTLILRHAGLEGLEVDFRAPPGPQGAAVRETLDRWNGAVVEASRGRLDARAAVPATLAGLGVLTFLFGRRRMPEWYDLMFWSFVTFVNLNPPAPGIVDDARN